MTQKDLIIMINEKLEKAHAPHERLLLGHMLLKLMGAEAGTSYYEEKHDARQVVDKEWDKVWNDGWWAGFIPGFLLMLAVLLFFEILFICHWR